MHEFPTLCWFETDRLRMGGAMRHSQHIFGNAKGVSALTPIEPPL